MSPIELLWTAKNMIFHQIPETTWRCQMEQHVVNDRVQLINGRIEMLQKAATPHSNIAQLRQTGFPEAKEKSFSQTWQ